MSTVRLLPSTTKLRRLCFYTCLSFCPRGGSASVHAGIPGPQEQTPRDQAPFPRQTATVADGTHPTGMHSCFVKVLVKGIQSIIQGRNAIFGQAPFKN